MSVPSMGEGFGVSRLVVIAVEGKDSFALWFWWRFRFY